MSRAGGDEGGQGWDGRTVLREMWGRQERRKTGRRRQETEEGGKYYPMRRWKSCGQHLTPDKGKRGRERGPTTKIDGVVCPQNISETVAGRLMKLAYRPRIASTMINSFQSQFSAHFILKKQFSESKLTRSANYRRHLIRPTPFPVSATLPRV